MLHIPHIAQPTNDKIQSFIEFKRVKTQAMMDRNMLMLTVSGPPEEKKPTVITSACTGARHAGDYLGATRMPRHHHTHRLVRNKAEINVHTQLSYIHHHAVKGTGAIIRQVRQQWL